MLSVLKQSEARDWRTLMLQDRENSLFKSETTLIKEILKRGYQKNAENFVENFGPENMKLL